MKDILQYEKANKKFSIIKKLIEELTEYNNLENYEKIKNFTFKINYYYDSFDKCYKYNIKLLRGLNDSKAILDLNLQYKEKLNEFILELINSLIKNEHFKYTCYVNKFEDESLYVINLNNNISVEFSINDNEDKLNFSNIEKRFPTKQICFYKEKIIMSEEIKDNLQHDKALKTIKIIKEILNSLCELNSIENYDNIKPFRVFVDNKFDPYKECNKFTFTIYRGNINEKKMFELSLSIKNTDVVYNEIYEMMIDLINRDEFVMCSISNNYIEKLFDIKLNNKISIEFSCKNEIDEKFYSSFYEEFKDTKYNTKSENYGKKLTITNN